MKYIVVSDRGLEQLIMFPSMLSHHDVAVRFGDFAPVSAGFVEGNVHKGGTALNCCGRSESLGLACRGMEDNVLLQLYLNSGNPPHGGN